MATNKVQVILEGDKEIIAEFVKRGHTRTCAVRMTCVDGVCQCGEIEKLNLRMRGIEPEAIKL